ncbi:hypothetical protein HDU97_000656 [Phlyctochytrium planicorne]|nr:hypothetical protein HDU97_000656 [Phlyctochytrium planicorne]
MSEAEELFKASVPFTIHDKGSPQEKRKQKLLVKVSLSSPKNGRLRVLEIELTDEQDLFFLYQSAIGEEDFHVLRQDQNLLVDFQQFPAKFLELLDHCREYGEDENPKFLAQISSQGGLETVLFSIIETNSFKHIIHIAIKLIRGNDTALKQHLASLIKQNKNEIAFLQEKLDGTSTSLSSQLKDTISSHSRLSAEHEKLKLSYAEQASKLELEFSRKLARETEQFNSEKERLKRKIDEEKASMQRSHDDKLSHMTERYDSLLFSNGRLKSDFDALHFKSENDKKIMLAYSEELKSLKQELEVLRESKLSLSIKFEDVEAQNKSAQELISKLQSALAEKAETISYQSTQLNALEDEKSKLNRSLEVCEQKIATLEETFKNASDEITKGNEIIRKLQSDQRTAKAKIKNKNLVTLQQEKLLDERASIIALQREEITTLKESSGKLSKECDDFKHQVEELQKRVDEGKQIIAENTQVIEWLHKQLNEDGLSRATHSFKPRVKDDAVKPRTTELTSSQNYGGYQENIPGFTSTHLSHSAPQFKKRDALYSMDQSSHARRDLQAVTDKVRFTSLHQSTEKSNYFP